MIYFVDFYRENDDVIHKISIDEGMYLGGYEKNLGFLGNLKVFLSMVYKDRPKQIIFDKTMGGGGYTKHFNLVQSLEEIGIAVSGSGELTYPNEFDSSVTKSLFSLI